MGVGVCVGSGLIRCIKAEVFEPGLGAAISSANATPPGNELRRGAATRFTCESQGF
jgi:hypothetical protein